MTDIGPITGNLRVILTRAAADLHGRFQGVFGHETIESVVFDSYARLATQSTVSRWLVVGAEKFAGERLDALVHAEDRSPKKLPAVLFLCVHNAGRSQMALGWFSHLAGDRAVAWSGGSDPGDEINAAAVTAMAEIGIDIAREFPKPWTDEFLRAADVVVTMGCGDSCPLVPGKHYEDWELDDPSGRSLEEVRLIRDEIGRRVADLMDRLDVGVSRS
jgi:protein-tyrosine-phosphatase